MNEHLINLLSKGFIISGVAMFVGAVMLAFLQHRRQMTASTLYEKKPEPKEKKNGRRHERHDYSHEVRYSHAEPPYGEGTAKGKDISKRGTGVYVPVHAKIRPGTKLDLELTLEKEKEPIRILGEVMWAEGLEDEKMEQLALISEFFARRIGIKFQDTHEDNSQRIEIFISGLAEKQPDKDEANS